MEVESTRKYHLKKKKYNFQEIDQKLTLFLNAAVSTIPYYF